MRSYIICIKKIMERHHSVYLYTYKCVYAFVPFFCIIEGYNNENNKYLTTLEY